MRLWCQAKSARPAAATDSVLSPSGQASYRPHEHIEALTEGAVGVIAGVMRRHGDGWHVAAAIRSKLSNLLDEPKTILTRHQGRPHRGRTGVNRADYRAIANLRAAARRRPPQPFANLRLDDLSG